MNKKLDRLLEAAREYEIDGGVHIITEGYCIRCKGPCKAVECASAVLIIDDIPRDYKIPDPEPFLLCQEAEPEAREIPEFSALTKEERRAVLGECVVIEQEEKKTSYRSLFGYG